VAGYAKMVYPQTVTHPSINRARRRVIETNVLPLSQATTIIGIWVSIKHLKLVISSHFTS